MKADKAQRLAREMTAQWIRENQDRLTAAGVSVPLDV